MRHSLLPKKGRLAHYRLHNTQISLLCRSFCASTKAMAWASSGNNNREMVGKLRSNGIIKSQEVYDAMLKVDRGNFIGRFPYEDSPQPIGHGVTISAPHMHAYALEYLKSNLKEGMRVLDIGSGSGYLTACFAYMVKAVEMKGTVVGIDCTEDLVESSKVNLAKQDPQLLQSGHLKVLKGDGWQGSKQNAPFNAIHVGAAASEIPQKLVDQLALGGQLVIPIDAPHGMMQELKLITKNNSGNVVEQNLIGVSFVPLRKNPSI